MKVYVVRALKAIALFIPIAAFVLVSQTFCFYNASGDSTRIDWFYQEEANSLDVVFMGASELYAGFSPGLAYDEFGFTSYLYVIASNPPNLIKSQLMEILKHQSPQLIVIEVNPFLYSDDSAQSEEPALRKYAENIPMSKNKIDTILNFDYDDKLSCFIPFIKYHGNWKYYVDSTLNAQNKLNQMNNPSLLKGMQTQIHNFEMPNNVIDVTNDNSKLDLTDNSMDLLMDLLEYIKESKVENVLFVRYPHIISSEDEYKRFQRSNKVEEIVTKNGFRYISLEKEIFEIGLNNESDYYNPEHLNVYGQEKMTHYLGQKIVEEFSLTPIEQTEENKQMWEKSADYSKQYFEYIKWLIADGGTHFPYENLDLISRIENFNGN